MNDPGILLSIILPDKLPNECHWWIITNNISKSAILIMNPSIWCTFIFYKLERIFWCRINGNRFQKTYYGQDFYWKMGAQKSVIERHPAFTTSSFDTSFVYLKDKLNLDLLFSLDYSCADWIFPFRALWS